MLKRLGHEIQVAIQRRKAAMTRAALPRLSARCEWLLTRRGPAEAATTDRAAPVEENSGAPAYEIEPLAEESDQVLTSRTLLMRMKPQAPRGGCFSSLSALAPPGRVRLRIR